MANTKYSIYDLEAKEKRYLFFKEKNEIAAQFCIEQLCWDFLTASVQPPNFFRDSYILSQQDALKKFKKYASDLFQTNDMTYFHKILLKCFYIYPPLYPLLYKLSPWHLRKPFQHSLNKD